MFEKIGTSIFEVFHGSEIKRLADGIENNLLEIYDLPAPYFVHKASNCLWLKPYSELQNMMLKHGCNVNPEYLAFYLRYSNSADEHTPAYVIYLPTQLLRQALQFDISTYTQQDSEQLRAYVILQEEISHLVYCRSYRSYHGVKPHSGMVELWGAIDQYNLLNKLSLDLTQRYLGTEQMHQAHSMIFSCALPQKNEGRNYINYTFGHFYANMLRGYLNWLFMNGKSSQADQTLLELYKAPNAQVIRFIDQVLFHVIEKHMSQLSPAQQENIRSVKSEVCQRI